MAGARQPRRTRRARRGCPALPATARSPSSPRRGCTTGTGPPRWPRSGIRTPASAGIEHRAAPPVAFALLGDMLVVIQRGDHGRLNGAGHHQAGVFAHLQQPGHHVRVARHETGPVAGHVRPLRQGMDGEQPLVTVPAYRGMEHGDRLGVPAEFDVALVADHQDAGLRGPTPRSPPGCPGRGRRRSGWPGSSPRAATPPSETGPGSRRRPGDGRAAGEPRPHLVGGVRQIREGHPAAHAEQPGQQRHQFLRTHRRQHGHLVRHAGATPSRRDSQPWIAARSRGAPAVSG